MEPHKEYLLCRGSQSIQHLEAIKKCPDFKQPCRKRSFIEAYILDNYPPLIDDDDLLVGKRYPLTDDAIAAYEEIVKFQNQFGMGHGGYDNNYTNHRAADYEKLLDVGVKGILDEIDHYLSIVDKNDEDKVAFYETCKASLEAFCRFAEKYRQAVLDMAQTETRPQRKDELLTIADVLSRVPYGPAEHFYDAIQCIWILDFCFGLVSDISTNGRPDNYLYKYYKKDLESGYITKEFAFKLVEQLYLRNNDLYGTWVCSLMLGGVDRQGNPVWNDLTEMFLEAIETVGLLNPTVGVCYTEDMPDHILDLCIDKISKGYTKPSLFNDKVIQAGLREAGMSVEDARYYTHSTCVEITPIGCSSVYIAMPYTNLNRCFEIIFSEKKCNYRIGKVSFFGPGFGGHDKEHILAHDIEDFRLEDLDTFDKFLALTKKVVAEIIGSHCNGSIEYANVGAVEKSSPLTSALTNDCLARGLDVGSGGARYAYVYPCFPGFINLIDSLNAIKKAVYEEKKLTLREMAALLESNFESDERMHQYLLNECPKFGNNLKESDLLGEELFEFIRDELKNYETCTGGKFHPSYFAWIFHGMLGEICMATPDGRKAGVALSEHIGAMQGMDTSGPLATMRSTAILDQKYGIGGIASNYRFSKNFITSPEGKEAVKSFIKSFMANGCFEIQFNVVDQKILQAAQENPDQYRNLMIRVAGFSEYFVNLDKVIQDEIMKRTEHDAI